MKNSFFFFILLLVLCSCSTKFDVGFEPMSNFPQGDIVTLDMDMENAVTDGIVIPSKNQSPSGFFDMNITVKGSHPQLFYKIYYQNESYKFDEGHALANENFYGSWEDVNVEFKQLKDNNITDSLRIVGNPRDEKIYYGEDIGTNPVTIERINQIVADIYKNKEWYESVAQKAEGNGLSVDEQVYADAVWMINHRKNDGDSNNRWKRNPRAGEYSFMLVVCDQEGLDMIPDHIKNVSKTNENGQFENPYGWFMKNTSAHIKVVKSPRRLKTRAVLSAENGVYVNRKENYNSRFDTDADECTCGDNDRLYHEALYEQFISDVSRQYTLRNIPLIKDVVGEDPYTLADYETAKTKYTDRQHLDDHPVAAKEPCMTVKVSPDGSYLSLINPHSTPDNMKKESTGIRSRVGFTYGKWRAKIKFPPMLNNDNIWNGLTYAFWLIYSDEHPWNNRRHNEVAGGYIDKYDDSDNPVRRTDYHYSEIDIEIVKASRYWPVRSYRPRTDTVNFVEDATQNNDVMFCSTNWDLASREPVNFGFGIDTIEYGDKMFETNRWSDIYKALTTRTPMPNAVFTEPYYYYEIEWRPTEIIWRVGPSPDKMQVMGYMNDSYTSIPNNQMRCIVTQEYHYSEWWPPIVWEQGLIPYNKTDIEGRVYEVVIE